MAVIGQIGRASGVEVIQRGIKATSVITKGLVVAFDTNGYATQADETDSIDNGYGVPLETKTGGAADGDVKVRIAVGNSWVFCKADAAIKPNNLVKVQTGTAVGLLIAHDKPAAATTPTAAEVDAARDYFGKTVGRYVCHDGEENEATDAAQNDVILVRLGV